MRKLLCYLALLGSAILYWWILERLPMFQV